MTRRMMRAVLLSYTLPIAAILWQDIGGTVPPGHEGHELMVEHTAMSQRLVGCRTCSAPDLWR